MVYRDCHEAWNPVLLESIYNDIKEYTGTLNGDSHRILIIIDNYREKMYRRVVEQIRHSCRYHNVTLVLSVTELNP